MEVLECLKCKGQLQLDESGLIGKCLSCDTVYHFKAEKSSRIIALLNQANIARLRGDYDGAILTYQMAIKEDDTDADAYWGLVLSRFGIEYVEDEKTKTIKPTCRRTIPHSILEDSDFKKALENASETQRADLIEKANEIDILQKAIKEKIKTESDFDVFLCFKSTDENGGATEDRIIARTIYDELNKRGIKTFFSEISLKDRLGQDYEPIIYKALYTAKVFILIATKEEYIQAPWVRNEWARFRDRISDEGLINASFAVFKDLKQSQLPAIFKTQGVDLSKYPVGGYEVEIADNLETRLKQKKYTSLNDNFQDMFKQNIVIEEKVVDLLEKKLVGSRQTFDEKIERVVTYHEIGQKEKALKIIDEIIDEYPRKALGWFTKAKLLTENFGIDIVEYHLNEKLQAEVKYCMDNALRFASDEQKPMFENSIKPINDKINVLRGVSSNLESLENDFQELVKFEDKINKENEIAKEKQVSDKQGYVSAISANTLEMKKLQKQLVNKNYYIKNIPDKKTPIKAFIKFLAVIAIITALVASIVKLAIYSSRGESGASVIVELIFLVLMGFLPYIIFCILKKQLKFKQVEHVIERDRKRFFELKSQNEGLKRSLASFDKQEKLEEEKAQEENKEFSDLRKHIANLYKKTKKLYILNDYVEKYIKLYEEFAKEQIGAKVKELKLEIGELNQKIVKISNQNKVLSDELVASKPKYFSSDYENLVKKTQENQKQNNETIAKLSLRVKENELLIKAYKLQIEKTISSENFFDGFLEEFKEKIETYTKEKEQEKQQEKEEKTEQKNVIIKEKPVVKKAVKTKQKVKRARKNRKK